MNAGRSHARNGADFDPATLHDWPDVADDFAAMANRWTEARSSEASQSARRRLTRGPIPGCHTTRQRELGMRQ